MKALVKTAPGPGNMELQDRPVPTVGDEDVLLEVMAAGICGSDLRMRRLGNSENLRAPVILGHEFAGVVAEVGRKVVLFRPGERIVSDNSGYLCGTCDSCAQGNYLMCEKRLGLGSGMNGGFAKYVLIPGQLLSVNPHTLYRIPDNVPFEDASMMDPLGNAYKALVQESQLRPGEDIAIFGLGTLGLLAVQIARLMGAANIIAVNRSDRSDRFEIARTFGATHVICSEKEDVAARIRDITKGAMLPSIVDCAGKNDVLKIALALLKKGGTFVRVGYDSDPFEESLDRYVNKGIRIQGHFAYDYVAWRNCLKLLALGKLDVRPILSAVLPLERWEEGFDLVESRRGIKVLLIPEE